ncbi:hypothetical protein M406DRAFT_63537 [Cryphonectria parasitica EP155]|uniref:Uncharacterized protein n=1 Tax=Cryphonectria parasitica (strain ATCC 38755 / EP155) TaxID=660469 RepID=A0A9P5CMB2_CRYP1|nr:uncharacterized protein M406DRAFT_63537 [Cryphonectria parasitica EP155]KAF3762710.1 hypothetical protein M406DRAFT_63537 [Cryphonectria parasitica EP155]
MSFKTFALFALLGASQATPTPMVLQHDDILLLRDDGPAVVMKEWEYQIQEDIKEVKRKANAPRESFTVSNLDRRCDESTEVQVLTDTTFNDWDVTMSPVLQNSGAGALIAVTQGYSLANSVSVSASVGTSLEGILSTTMTIDTTETWTTTDSQTWTFNVPAGQYGLVVSNPLVRRITGNVISGCTDTPTTDAFTSDSYSSQQSGDLAWVTGPIRLCNSTAYPIPYCIGTGTHS